MYIHVLHFHFFTMYIVFICIHLFYLSMYVHCIYLLNKSAFVCSTKFRTFHLFTLSTRFSNSSLQTLHLQFKTLGSVVCKQLFLQITLYLVISIQNRHTIVTAFRWFGGIVWYCLNRCCKLFCQKFRNDTCSDKSVNLCTSPLPSIPGPQTTKSQ